MRSRTVFILAAAGALAACASTGPGPAPDVQAPDTEVYMYPQSGQSAAQQDRDRYECYLWAVKQSGFDPSQPGLGAGQRVAVEPAPAEGGGVVAGAATGAVAGAMIGGPHDSGEGAVIGAVAGAVVGGAIEQSAREQQQAASVASEQSELDRQAGNYRRAMGACLEGRGYVVR